MEKIYFLAGLIFIMLFLFGFFSFSYFFEKPLFCGDKTPYGNCSSNKPYFCEEGLLVKKASVCGCPEILEQKEDICFSEYRVGEKEVILKYAGGEINLSVYEGVKNYLESLPNQVYSSNGTLLSKQDFKMREINEPLQREFLIPLVVDIQNLNKDKKEQVKIAVRLVQNIPYGVSEKKDFFGGKILNHSRSIYEVIYNSEGICGEKSNLLSFLLREIGFGTAIFYYAEENHEAVGIKCSSYKDFEDTGYCFIETTEPYEIGEYEFLKKFNVTSNPEIIFISDGIAWD